MSNYPERKPGLLRTGINVLFVLLLISLPFLYHYFWNFYTSSWNDYKEWYPNSFFIVFPVIKILPFAFLAIVTWLWRKQLVGLIRASKRWIAGNYKNILFSLFVGAIILVVAEFVLRKNGFKPGYRVYSIYFSPVDSLFVLEGFSADSNGILTVSAKAREFICEELERKNCTYELSPISDSKAVNVYVIPENFVTLHGYNYKSTFKSFLQKLEHPADTSDNDFFEAVKYYSNCPINTDGYKSIEFKKYRSKRKSILLIGDSFTWGHSASNLTNCFADLLLAKGYIVYNTGIEATDPTQYLEVAKKYIPELRPDYVVVNFYIGNDVMYFERKPKPYVPAFYSTNAGNLMACPEGVYFDSAEEAYQYTLAHFTIPQGDSRFNDLCSKTVLSTLAWNAITAWKPEWTMSRYEDYYQKIKQAKTEMPYSDIQLREMKKISEAGGAKFLLTVIPMYDGNKLTLPADYPVIFEGLDYHVPNVTKDDYENRNDGHYNDRGHARHAAFIDSLVRNDD